MNTTPIVPHDFGEPLLEWEALIEPVHNRSRRWYSLTGTGVIGIAAFSILTGAWSVALVTLLCAGLYVLAHNHTPSPRRLAVYEHGLVFDGAYHTWKEFSSFWFLRTREFTQLRLERVDGRQGTAILTGSINPDRLKQLLSAYIPEDTKKTENILDTISRICKL